MFMAKILMFTDEIHHFSHVSPELSIAFCGFAMSSPRWAPRPPLRRRPWPLPRAFSIDQPAGPEKLNPPAEWGLPGLPENYKKQRCFSIKVWSIQISVNYVMSIDLIGIRDWYDIDNIRSIIYQYWCLTCGSEREREIYIHPWIYSIGSHAMMI